MPHHHPSLPRVLGAWPLCMVSVRFATPRSAVRATLNGGGGSSGDGDSRHQLSPAPAPPPSTKMLHLHTGTQRVGRAIGRGSRDPCPHIIDAAQPAAESSSWLRRQLGGARALRPFGATLKLLEPLRCVVHPVHHHHHLHHRRVSNTPLSFTSLPAPPLRSRACCCPRSHCPAPNQPRPVAGFRFSSAHTPTPACTRLATLVPLTLTRPPSRCTTRCDAWLTRVVADSSSLPTDLLASIAKPCSHHSFGFELCEFHRRHHPIPISRDFTFTSGYLCFTLRRFTSQHPHLHARH